MNALAIEKSAILFVCTGNTGRSPMAEGLANQVLHWPSLGYHAFSRGIKVNPAKRTPEVNAVTVMRQLGANIADGEAQSITLYDIGQAEWVLTMTLTQRNDVRALDPHAAAKIMTLSECANGTMHDIPDAYGHDMAVYRATRNQIATYLKIIQDKVLRVINDT